MPEHHDGGMVIVSKASCSDEARDRGLRPLGGRLDGGRDRPRLHRNSRGALGVLVLGLEIDVGSSGPVGSIHHPQGVVDFLLNLDVKQLKRLVAEQDLGPVAIKMRGLDLAPETLRTQLRVRGSHPATLILAGGAGPAKAILAQRPRLHRLPSDPIG